MRHDYSLNSILLFSLLVSFGLTSTVYAQSAGRLLRARGSNSNSNTNENSKQNQDKVIHDEYVKDLPAEVTITELSTEDFDKVVSDLKLTKEQDEKLKGLRADIASQRKALLDAQRDLREKFIKSNLSDMQILAPRVIETRNSCMNFKARQIFFNGLVNILLPDQRAILTAKNVPAPGQKP